MKVPLNLLLLFVLLFCVSPFCLGQDHSNCDQLQDKVTKLEQLDINAMSSSIRQLYKESLLKVYTQFGQCIQRDILATTRMLKAVEGTNAAPAVQVKLRALSKQKKVVDGRIEILRTTLDLNEAAAKNVDAGADAAAPLADVPAPALAPLADVRAPAVAPLADVRAPGGATGAAPDGAGGAAPGGAGGLAVPAAITCAPGVTYPDPPLILSDIATKAAVDVVNDNDEVDAIAPLLQMMVYTVFDAASPKSSKMLRQLPAYEYLSETARTDKQLGASAKSDGAVSAIEKPGFARLLGFAIENGGITKKNDGTTLTLSTSLYSLYAMKEKDTAETYARAGILNRVAVAASFGIANKENELASARRNNLSEWSVKARLFGDRSTRSPGFQKFWDSEIRPLISLRLQALGSAADSLASRLSKFNDIEKVMRRCIPADVGKRMKDPDYIAATDDGKKKIIKDMILASLKANVFDNIANGSLKLKAEDIANIEQEFIPRLKGALDNLVLADKEIKEKIADLNKGPLGTFAYTNHRQPNASDYSETKFLYEQEKGFLGPLKLTGNLGLSFYHRPDQKLKQQKLRDVSAALSFNGSTASPFTEAENQSKITYSFVGRYERMFENRRLTTRKPDIGTVQFVLEIPFVKGLSLPFSLSYANATEEQRKKNVKFNFGLHLDTDKLFELLGVASKP